MKTAVVILTIVLFASILEVCEAGFGCPFNQYQCHSHCVSIGCRAGYCAGWIKQTCTCSNPCGKKRRSTEEDQPMDSLLDDTVMVDNDAQ